MTQDRLSKESNGKEVNRNERSERSPFSAPSISLPKGGGAIQGIGEKFAANPVTGTGSLSVPIAVSPGRTGFAPQLSLSYDSGSGNGPFGFGWSLSLPSITRKTEKGLPQYRDADESDIYLLSGAEDLVPVLNADGTRFRDTTTAPGYIIHRYRPRIEGLFARIERWTHGTSGEIHWRSIGRDNVTTVYGRTGESRITDPDNPGHIFSWLICESYDDKGNAMLYRYAAENDANVNRSLISERNRVRTANRYLKRILYGNRESRLIQPDLSAADWMFEAVFDYDEMHYEEIELDPNLSEAEQHRFVRASNEAGGTWAHRPDPFSGHRAGFEVRSYRRCRRMLMFHHFDELGSDPCLVRTTEFDYDDLDYSLPVTVHQELAHSGSTRFASFIRAVSQSGYVRDESRPVLERDGVRYVSYLKKSLPPLEFEYSKARIQEDVRTIDPESLENLPIGLDGTIYQWVDLDGEGVSGILTEQADAWLYKPNLGDGRFGPVERVATIPSLADLNGKGQQLLDLDGDGRIDLVDLRGVTPGFYERSDDYDWEPFRSFVNLPNIPWSDPNLRFVDLNGDGRADVLIAENEVFTWYPSLAEDGFGSEQQRRQPIDEEEGPRLLIADGSQSIYLADMCGDGLTDLVRIRNGEVCYWPNLGYGRFGAKVTMDNGPWFDNPDQFNYQYIRLADIDGSGANDIIYLGRNGVRLYFNQSGNRFSEARRLTRFPKVENFSSVTTADLLGNGTACLVWSTPLPNGAGRQMQYIDLMGGIKPHLLIGTINNLGAETWVRYVASTEFYLSDKRAGRPWVTRIPFPVHVVERVETYDRISGNRFVTRYAYHHGYFDGVEREFRGFGLVEQWDTEEFSALNAGGAFPTGTNIDASSHIPPVLTRTWFHTGAYLDRHHISDYHAGLSNTGDRGEYYREPGLTDAQARTRLLDDTVLPAGLTAEEERQACRALKGAMLRSEVFALDGTAKAEHPYMVTEQNFTIKVLQRRRSNRHAVFLTHAREGLIYHYERNPDDPRIGHELTLETDRFGNVLKSAAVTYGRRQPDMNLSAEDRTRQSQVYITYTENDFTEDVDTANDYRTPLQCEVRTYELTGYAATGTGGRYRFGDFIQPGVNGEEHIFDDEIEYEEGATGGRQRRLIEHIRHLFRHNNLTVPLGLGELHSLALPYESYRKAFTIGLIAGVYGGRVGDPMLQDEGRYVHSGTDVNWWIPSGRMFLSPDPTHTPAQELAWARAHFFLPHRYRDPFHTGAVSTESHVRYDAYDLLIEETRDALGNRMTVGERNVDPTLPLVRKGQNYRVLQAELVMDPNRNRAAVAFDALGMVVGTAVMGKPAPAAAQGDSLSGFEANPTEAVVQDHLTNPLAAPASILGRASTRLLYDLFAYHRTKNQPAIKPAVVYSLARETHDSDPVPVGGLKIGHSFSYSDGFGREIQKKVRAEDGPVPQRDMEGKIIVGADGLPQMTPTDVSPRWVGSGWTVFNNKGKGVRQYEPFFTDRHAFEFDVRIGVSPVLFYDPLERVVGTLHPNHTWEKSLFNPWRQETWDASDTIVRRTGTSISLFDPKTDPDVGDFFRRLPDAEYLPTWYEGRQGVGVDPREQAAANKSAIHAATPTVAHFDSLGRQFLTIAHNRYKRSDSPPADPPIEEYHRTRVIMDIEGNQRSVIDARDRLVMLYNYDMLGNRIHQSSMEAGERWTLNDVAGKPFYSWNSRGYRFRTVSDPLRRPTETHQREGVGPEVLVERVVYGETRPSPEADNLRGKVYQSFDQAGVVTSDRFDFKGNLLRSSRQLAEEYKETLNWSGAVALETPSYTSSTSYDALNRPVELTPPDSSRIRPIYNEAGLLNGVETNLRGGAGTTTFVANIDYDAKGQRTRIVYGNGVSTAYRYDPRTYLLTRLLTRRDPAVFVNDCPEPPPAGWPGCQVQNLHYTYDPVGNITHVRDDAQQRIYFDNHRVEPSTDYTYDAVYRLIEAAGREHLGQTAGVAGPPTAPDHFSTFHTRLDHPTNGRAMGNYIERYLYDFVGNILSMQHRGSAPTHPGWERTYLYDEDSQLEAGVKNNRLSSTTIGAVTATYEYDGSAGLHGNITSMRHLPIMLWDEEDQLRATAKQAVSGGDTPETTWYVYNSEGVRVRKVTERYAPAAGTPTRLKERIYLGGFEIYREYAADGTTVELERETLHIMDDTDRIALVETRTQGDDPAPEQLIRYQFSNHLGSAALELDHQGQIISYEEYYPYGSTSYQAVRNLTETPKRYRYTGKERDEENGFFYHGARYYASWLGRWTACDPIGIGDGPNLYQYAQSNPVRYIDPDGKQTTPPPPRPLPPIGPIREGMLIADSPGLVSRWQQAVGNVLERRFGGGSLAENMRRFQQQLQTLPRGSNRTPGSAIHLARQVFNSVNQAFRRTVPLPPGTQIHHAFEGLAQNPSGALNPTGLEIARGHATVPGTTHHRAHLASDLRASGRFSNPGLEATRQMEAARGGTAPAPPPASPAARPAGAPAAQPAAAAARPAAPAPAAAPVARPAAAPTVAPPARPTAAAAPAAQPAAAPAAAARPDVRATSGAASTATAELNAAARSETRLLSRVTVGGVVGGALVGLNAYFTVRAYREGAARNGVAGGVLSAAGSLAGGGPGLDQVLAGAPAIGRFIELVRAGLSPASPGFGAAMAFGIRR